MRRDPAIVMRLGAFHQTWLSFMRQLTRRMQRERWTFTRPAFEIDPDGVGHAVLTATGPTRSYSLVAFAHDVARRIGIGNSTGFGMAPFIVNHPRPFDRWIGAREEALALDPTPPALTGSTCSRSAPVPLPPRSRVGEPGWNRFGDRRS